jgi:hypothetical protein
MRRVPSVPEPPPGLLAQLHQKPRELARILCLAAKRIGVAETAPLEIHRVNFKAAKPQPQALVLRKIVLNPQAKAALKLPATFHLILCMQTYPWRTGQRCAPDLLFHFGHHHCELPSAARIFSASAAIVSWSPGFTPQSALIDRRVCAVAREYENASPIVWRPAHLLGPNSGPAATEFG